MNWKIIGIGLLVTILLATGIGVYVYFSLENGSEKTNDSIPKETVTTESKEDIDQEVVNEPVEESILTLADGTSGHSFIAKYHQFYNQTLGWGRIETADYAEQRRAAQEILEKLEGAEINHDDLAADIESIKHYAKIVTERDDRDAMRMLHRYFHDLDIYLNGYDYSQTWDVTKFKP